MKHRNLLVLGLPIVLGSCLNPHQEHEAQQIALSDPRFADILGTEGYEVTAVRRPAYETSTDAVVEIELDRPLDIDRWPPTGTDPSTDPGYCDFPGTTPDAVGVRWVVDLRHDDIVTVTPLWEVTDEWPTESCYDV